MGEAESIYQLEALCTFTRGVTFSKKDQLPDDRGIGILRSHNVVFEDNKVSLHNLMYVKDTVRVKDEQRLKKDDLLISISNSKEQTGKLGISPNDTDLYIGGFMAIIRAEPLINPYFLFLNLSTKRFKSFISGRNQGTTNIWNITFNRIKDFEIPLPPLGEQKRIAALFQSIDAAIEQAEEQEKNLLQTKRQLLNELFSEKGEFGHYLTSDNYKSGSFGELAQNMSKRVEPSQTDLKVYVGLEHLDPDNLRIERQGVPDDVKGVKLLIWKGDIIFGKRRAYQRKVAVSHFDGICSAHSMVLRAKEKAVNKEFLPYFMQSDVFMNRAIQISEGSLSPTIKWKVLEKQDFSIPKIEYQEKLTDLFKQFDKLIYQLREQNQTLKKLKHQLLDEILG